MTMIYENLKRLAVLMLSLGLIMAISSQVLALYLSYFFHVRHVYRESLILEVDSPRVIKLGYTDVVSVRYNITFKVDEPFYVDVAFKGGELNLVLEAKTHLVTKRNNTVHGELLIDGKLDSVEIILLNGAEVMCELILTYTVSPGIYHIVSIISALLGVIGLGLFIYGIYSYLVLRRSRFQQLTPPRL